jgi:choline dehydrogenase-like flavoprotein
MAADPFPVLEEAARRTPVRYETEVLVVGAGSAGVAAAVAAARNGAEVMLVERYGYLGGLATGGLILLLLTLDDGLGRAAGRPTSRRPRSGEAATRSRCAATLAGACSGDTAPTACGTRWPSRPRR